MPDWLIRAAVSLYPEQWRRAYGDDMAWLLAEALEDQARSIWSKALLIADLVTRGLLERLRPIRRQVFINGVLSSITVAVILVEVVATDRSSGGSVAARDPNAFAMFARHVYLGRGVIEMNKPYSSTSLPWKDITRVSGGNQPYRQIYVLGAPASIRINPVRDMIVSITRARSTL